MKRFIEGEDRSQSTLFPERLEDYIAEDNAVRVIDAFVEQLDLEHLEFKRAQASATGRPGYQPATLLKIYVYGYLNRIQSSRRLERESHRNVELIWLTGRLMPDFKSPPSHFQISRAHINARIQQLAKPSIALSGAASDGVGTQMEIGNARLGGNSNFSERYGRYFWENGPVKRLFCRYRIFNFGKEFALH